MKCGDFMIKSFVLCIVSIFFIYGLILFLFQMKNSVSSEPTYIIRTYNDQDTIEGTIRLALMKNCIIIVIDSGSTDDTKEIVKKMVTDYPNIILIEKEQC